MRESVVTVVVILPSHQIEFAGCKLSSDGDETGRGSSNVGSARAASMECARTTREAGRDGDEKRDRGVDGNRKGREPETREV